LLTLGAPAERANALSLINPRGGGVQQDIRRRRRRCTGDITAIIVGTAGTVTSSSLAPL